MHLQAEQQRKSFTAQLVSLNNCDLFLAVLLFMQEIQNCSHKTWHIRIDIVSNGCSRISFKDTHREKALLHETLALSESMNKDIRVVGTSNQFCITVSYTERKLSKK